MRIVDIESVSTSSMTNGVIINVQIILIRVVQRAQSKATLRTNVMNSESKCELQDLPASRGP